MTSKNVILATLTIVLGINLSWFLWTFYYSPSDMIDIATLGLDDIEIHPIAYHPPAKPKPHVIKIVEKQIERVRVEKTEVEEPKEEKEDKKVKESKHMYKVHPGHYAQHWKHKRKK